VHSLRSQVRIGTVSNCLLGEFDRILMVSDSEAGMKQETRRGVAAENGECGNDVVGLLTRDRRRLGILNVKKKAKLY